ncbi:hypothetical protein H8K90_02150 [Winogradskyella echinorum]|uniref:DltD C-terminal region n=1 Tax=Winogradskyella echinorum TaxID=538189 RepID=A0ABR6XXG1_9FLAO|nr:hypothetical protein [Winogradskyella echinorum]MBC3845170.1 hypothetical protein [Winogradskyella echinorum]MBC5749518.1 hypothetical protein [Winogradskyella echinorum]
MKSRNFDNSNLKNSVNLFEKKKEYDLLFMGISHARVYSRGGNHAEIERILDASVLNISKGNAMCGLEDQIYYFNYVIENNIKIKKVVLVLSPTLFLTNHLNYATNTFNDEPLELSFYFNYYFYDAPNKHKRLFNYVKSKYNPKEWIKKQPLVKKKKTKIIDSINQDKLNDLFKLYYPNKFDGVESNKQRLFRLRNICRENDIKLQIIIPSALFGAWPGHDLLVNSLNEMGFAKSVDYYDFSRSIMDKKYYYDEHHLNSEGVEYFFTNFLETRIK